MKKHGIKSLSELSNIKVEKKHNSYRKHRKSVSESSSSSSESESEEEEPRKHKEESKKKYNTKSSSSGDYNKKHHYLHKKGNCYRDKEPDKHLNERNKDRDYKKSPTRNSSENVNSEKTRRHDKEKVCSIQDVYKCLSKANI